VGVGQSQYEIGKYVDVNVGGTANLLDILVNTKNSVRKLVVAARCPATARGFTGARNTASCSPPCARSPS